MLPVVSIGSSGSRPDELQPKNISVTGESKFADAGYAVLRCILVLAFAYYVFLVPLAEFVCLLAVDVRMAREFYRTDIQSWRGA